MPSVRTGKKPEEPGRGTPSYMLTYGDMTTLLLVFFVFLFQVTEGVSEARVNAAISSFRQALGVMPSSISVLRPDEVMLVPRERGTKNFFGEKQQIEDLEKMFRKEIEKMKDLGPAYITTMKGQKELKINIGSEALFSSGEASIKPAFKKSLDQIAEFIKKNHLKVEVQGHTDNQPISTSLYPSNWELSSARATGIVRYFINQHGIPAVDQYGRPELTAVGYADTVPVATNDTPEGREKNRRIEIILKPTAQTPMSAVREAKDIFGGAEF